jgi:hypothetical protein
VIRKLSIKASPLEKLLVERWEWLGKIKRGLCPVAEIEALRAKARDLQHWEIVRQCDEVEAKFGGKKDLFDKLYFGTHLKAYRQYLVKEYAGLWSPAGEYEWRVGGGEAPQAYDFLLTEDLSSKSRPLEERLLRALAGDFYRPMNVPHLFGEIYSEEFFHPQSSAQRIHQAVALTRKWLLKKAPLLRIEQEASAYVLRSTAAVLLKIPGFEADPLEKLLQALRTRFGNTVFTATAAATALSLPVRTTRRRLQEFTDRGWIKSYGKSSNKSFRFE